VRYLLLRLLLVVDFSFAFLEKKKQAQHMSMQSRMKIMPINTKKIICY